MTATPLLRESRQSLELAEPAVLPVAAFVAGLAPRGLALRVEGEDGGEGGRLILRGPAEARTEKIRAYLRTQKSAIVEYLDNREQLQRQVLEEVVCTCEREEYEGPDDREDGEEGEEWASICALGASLDADLRAAMILEPKAGPQSPSESGGDGGDAAFGERIRAAYLAACGGFMPFNVRVDLGGATTMNPGAWFLATDNATFCL